MSFIPTTHRLIQCFILGPHRSQKTSQTATPLTIGTSHTIITMETITCHIILTTAVISSPSSSSVTACCRWRLIHNPCHEIPTTGLCHRRVSLDLLTNKTIRGGNVLNNCWTFSTTTPLRFPLCHMLPYNVPTPPSGLTIPWKWYPSVSNDQATNLIHVMNPYIVNETLERWIGA